MIILDTNIAIHLRDRDAEVALRLAQVSTAIAMSVVTRVELENGLHGDVAVVASRRRGLDHLITAIPTLFLTEEDVRSYRAIVAAHGKGGRRTLDWVIAAQAMARRATLATRNAEDFRMIDGLRLETW